MARIPKIKLKDTAKISYSLMRFIGSGWSLVVHTAAFAVCFLLVWFGAPLEKVLLVLTTAVSLEAIYMAIFIQMAVNQNTESLEEVEEDIDEIAEDVDEIQKDVDEIEKDVDEIQKDVDDIQEDVVDMEKEVPQLAYDSRTQVVLSNIESQLQNLIKEIEVIKNERK